LQNWRDYLTIVAMDNTLQKLIELAKADGGKFFVIDEKGEPKLIIMPIEDYEKLLLGKVRQVVEDVEKVNQEILKAQLQEEAPTLKPTPPKGPTIESYPEISKNDLRAEVIDPSFDFEGPKIEIDDL